MCVCCVASGTGRGSTTLQGAMTTNASLGELDIQLQKFVILCIESSRVAEEAHFIKKDDALSHPAFTTVP